MTAHPLVPADSLVPADELTRATERLLATAADLDGVDQPSPLPGWTRGHVLTHVARNADSLVNLLTWARTGVVTPQYRSPAGRDADIEAGAGRPLDAQLADVRSTHDGFLGALAAMSPEAWNADIAWRSGRVGPAREVPWARMKEVEIHHVDLGAAYRPGDWPEWFAVRLLRETVARMSLPVELRAGDHVFWAGAGPVVAGPVTSVAGWLTGRSDGSELSSDEKLPEVPSWG